MKKPKDEIYTIELTSLKDDKIQLARLLSTQKGRIKTGKFLLEGKEAVNWAISAGITLDYVLCSNKEKDLTSAFPHQMTYTVSEGLLKKITGRKYVIPTLAVGNIKEQTSNPSFCLVLDNIQDFGNIGTIVRTGQAFGINHIISTQKNFDLFQKKTIDASRGGVFKSNLETFDTAIDTIRRLKQRGCQIVTTSPRGSQLQSQVVLSGKPVALVIGNETSGVSEDFTHLSDALIQIPMSQAMESLNVGVSAGISIYEIKLKQIISMIEQQIKATLGRAINVVGMLVKTALDQQLSKVSDLSSRQLVFLMVLKCDTRMTFFDAQKQFGIPDREKKSFFQPLKDKGYLNISDSDSLTITESGIATIGKLWTIIENTENEILEDFSEDEKRTLRCLLKRVEDKCEQMIEGNS